MLLKIKGDSFSDIIVVNSGEGKPGIIKLGNFETDARVGWLRYRKEGGIVIKYSLVGGTFIKENFAGGSLIRKNNKSSNVLLQ